MDDRHINFTFAKWSGIYGVVISFGACSYETFAAHGGLAVLFAFCAAFSLVLALLSHDRLISSTNQFSHWDQRVQSPSPWSQSDWEKFEQQFAAYLGAKERND